MRASREDGAALRDALAKTEAEARVLRENEAKLLADREATAAETADLRSYASLIHNGQRRQALLHLLTSEHLHGARANRAAPPPGVAGFGADGGGGGGGPRPSTFTEQANGKRLDHTARVRAQRLVEPTRQSLLRFLRAAKVLSAAALAAGGGGGGGGGDAVGRSAAAVVAPRGSAAELMP